MTGISDEEFVRSEKWKLLPAFIKMKGIARHHIESFNYLVDVEMKKIVEHNALVTSDSNPSIYLRYTNIYVEPPTIEQDMVVSQVTPNECRLRDLTYAGAIKVDVEFTKLGKDGNQRFTKTGQTIGKLPMMLKCNKCHLYNKNFEELAKLRECPYDPGGYFIVKGVEKAFLMQEQMSKNRIIIETGKLGISATCASHTHTSKGKTTIVFGKDKGMYLKHNSLTDLMPIFVVMRAMGVQSDQELVQMVGTEPSMMLYLYPCIYACKKNNVYTQQDALEFFGNHMKPKQWLTGREVGPKKSKADEAADFLANILLCHVPVVNWDFHQKVVYLAVMLRRMILSVDDPSQLDDKDYYGNKRLELAGQLLALLFEDLFKTYNSNLKAAGETCLKKAARAQQFDFVQVMNCTNMTRGFNYAISSGNWNIKRFKVERSGVTQVLRRMARIDTVGMITRVNSHFEKSRKVSGPRTLQPSTWGMLCPSDTPEGESCGLVKNMSLMSVVTSDLEEKPVYTTCLNLGMEDIDMVFGEDLQLHTVVSLNGLIIGIHRHPDAFVVAFRTLRRAGRLYPSASIYQNKSQKCVYISTDGGRLCRPLIIVTHQKGSVRSHHLHELAEGVRNFEDFLREGLVEFLDVNEENDCFIALREENIDAETTHLEIEPFTLLGVIAGLIPYPHHNQSPRNTYQCAMGKQAMGAIAYNQFTRIDTILYLMNYPQKPMVKTRIIDETGFEKLPAGINVTLAVMSYSGYDIEDAAIHNKWSIERSYARCMVMKKQCTTIKRYTQEMFDVLRPPPVDCTQRHNFKFRHLDSDGIIPKGVRVVDGDVLVNKYIPAASDEGGAPYRPAPLCYKGPVPGYVDQVLISTDEEDTWIIKVLLRETRAPELGDKFSSRHGQKGVCGLIQPAPDLPFNDHGMNPDLIMNPHGFPSRMTVGKMIELVAGKAGVLEGKLKYGTAFGGDRVADCGRILVQHGYNYHGRDQLYSGITGEPLEAYVFMGPVYYQKLKHMVLDKMHARGRGPCSALTRQPTEGRSRDGGLRLGEMERDCLIGHGASNLLKERLLHSSDEFNTDVCKACGLIGYSGWCQYCKSRRDVVSIKMPYACKLLFQELMAMNIVPRLTLQPL
eukprot:GGOE01042677.1.p1 GENE.GGOE01042677.1~~GGOE01042677.1.p1  ORF type:complete len:1135 (-),score=406.12 GGOE01042677.1:113-3463(-)